MTAVDVVVPCYNYARYLRGCVESVLSQRDVDVRVLIIDDKSSDNTPEVGQELAASDNRVTFRRHEVNEGLIGTANEGIEWLESPYWLLLSADDALTPGALARATTVLDAHPEVGMVYGLASIVWGEGEPQPMSDPAEATLQILSGEMFLRRSCERGNPVPSPSAIVRTALQKKVGGYSPRLTHTSDMEMWMRLATCSSIGIIREAQAFFRMHDTSMSAQYTKGLLSDRRERIETCEYALLTLDHAEKFEFSEWIANLKRCLGKEVIWLAGQCIERGDIAGYEQCLSFVEDYQPQLMDSRQGRTLRIKKALGPVATRTLANALRSVRKAPANAITAPSEQRVYGWWPEATELKIS